MKQEVLYFFSTLTTVFGIIDPFAVVPVYITLTSRHSADQKAVICRKAVWVATGLLLIFSSTGMTLFQVFGITLPAFQIGGGILLMLFGMAQLNSNRRRMRPEEQEEGMEKEDISVFPLGMPLLAGPGAISTVVLLSTKAQSSFRVLELLLAVTVAMLGAYWVLKSAQILFRFLGQTGLNLVTRIMGLILTANGVQFILTGIENFLRISNIIPT